MHKGYSRGTQGVLEGVLEGYSNISRAARRLCALYLPFECGARPLLVRAVAADVYLQSHSAVGVWG